MGWLDLLFGKGATRKAKTIQKIAKAASPPKATPKAPKAPPTPKLEWVKSENGNDTAIHDGFRITLFKRDGLWNYCVVEILDEEDIADGTEEMPIFGDGYPTKAEARREAMLEVE